MVADTSAYNLIRESTFVQEIADKYMDIFKNTKPEFLLMASDLKHNRVVNLGILIASKSLGIPVYFVQTDRILKDNPFNLYFNLFEKAFFQGVKSLQVAKMYGFKGDGFITDSRLINNEYINSDLDKEILRKKKILVATRSLDPASMTEFYEAISQIALDNEDCCFFIKKHPEESIEKIKALLDLSNKKNILIVDNGSVTTWVEKSDIIITPFSNVAIERLSKRKADNYF